MGGTGVAFGEGAGAGLVRLWVEEGIAVGVGAMGAHGVVCDLRMKPRRTRVKVTRFFHEHVVVP